MADALREVGQALDEPGLEALATRGAAVDPAWLPVARALAPAIDAGASPAASLEAVSVSAARRVRTDAAIAAGEMGVRVALPLTLCLLPAFLAVGLAPLLVAVMGGAFAGVP
ncbi:hypothetical protein [Demequina sediminis]|uniref:hypothetical protein n=1 Tax=Demequina sediminis TaxID=1930058 RepID=UPI002573F7AD|nr:hypothetical protein [Demequina sediminis]